MKPETGLDRIDFEILRALSNDARLSNKELAARVELAPSSAFERVKRLREAGVLRGFHAVVDPTALGISLQAMTAVRLAKHSRQAFASFHEYAIGLEEVVAFYQVAGEDDFLVHTAVPDAERLRDVTDRFAGHEAVMHMSTALIFEHDRKPVWPVYRSR
jgi:DNA-binding Lrp family transcriptional regulator